MPHDEIPVPERILVSRLRFLGDVVLTTPLVQNLRRLFPGAEIDYLTQEAYAPVLVNQTDIDRVWALPSVSGPAGMLRYLKLLARLRRRRYDWYLDLLFNPRSALTGVLIGARLRVGGDRRRRRRYYHRTFRDPEETRSAIEVHLEALRSLGFEVVNAPTRIDVPASERRKGERILESAGIVPSANPILLHPGGTWRAKRWPEGHFARLCELIGERGGGTVGILSGPGERDIARKVVDQSEARAALLPPLSLRQVSSVLSGAGAVVANDGGILHLAVALGRPTVGIFGPTETDIWFPYDGRTSVRLAYREIPCRPCHRHECGHRSCLTELPPESVWSALEEVMPS